MQPVKQILKQYPASQGITVCVVTFEMISAGGSEVQLGSYTLLPFNSLVGPCSNAERHCLAGKSNVADNLNNVDTRVVCAPKFYAIPSGVHCRCYSGSSYTEHRLPVQFIPGTISLNTV